MRQRRLLIVQSLRKIMDTNTNDKPRHKKPYVKPQVRRVMLRPEEAVLASCKTAKVSGPGQKRCNTPSACSSLLS
jgi:hypothetical protein